MPYIEVMEKDLARLRELAGIFEVKDVITRLIDDFLEDYTKPEVISEAALAGAEEFSFDDLPSLVHVKFVSARIGEIASNANTWNGFLNQVLEVAFSRLGSITPIQRSVGLNIISGEKLTKVIDTLKLRTSRFKGFQLPMRQNMLDSLLNF